MFIERLNKAEEETKQALTWQFSQMCREPGCTCSEPPLKLPTVVKVLVIGNERPYNLDVPVYCCGVHVSIICAYNINVWLGMRSYMGACSRFTCALSQAEYAMHPLLADCFPAQPSIALNVHRSMNMRPIWFENSMLLRW
jgi:hypothetical protein